VLDDTVAQDCLDGVRGKGREPWAIVGTTDEAVAVAFQPTDQVHGPDRHIFDQQQVVLRGVIHTVYCGFGLVFGMVMHYLY
jgi:hypothetical protein